MHNTQGAPVERAVTDLSGEPGTEEQAVEFYWRPGCVFCMSLRRGLRRRCIPVEEHNIWADPGAAQQVRSVAGGTETVPTVIVAGHWMVNPTAGQVESLLAEHAPEVLALAAERVRGRGGFFRRMFSRG